MKDLRVTDEVLPWDVPADLNPRSVKQAYCNDKCVGAIHSMTTKRVMSTRPDERKARSWPIEQDQRPWDRCSRRSKGRSAEGQVDQSGHDDRSSAASVELMFPEEANKPLCQTRCCIGGLLVLAALRGCAVRVYTSPAGLVWTAHMLSCAADGIATLGSLPVFVRSAIGSCIHHRCLGSLLTLLLTATVCDLGAVVIFLSTAGGTLRLMGPVATDEGAPAAVAFIGVWECILLSSISLEFALCLSAWQFYRVFREAGIYPPSAANVSVYKEVSTLEFLCEAEDVALLSDQCSACNRVSSRANDEAEFVKPHDVVPHSEFEEADRIDRPPLYQPMHLNRL